MLEVYCGRRSYAQGEEVELHVSTDAQSYDLTIVRSGLKEEVVLSQQGLTGQLHPVPADAATHGCGWPVALRLPTGSDWRSGFYKVQLTSASGELGEGAFIVRSKTPAAKILWAIETNTYNAYNFFGGKSAYTDGGIEYGRGATQVSFHRPYANGFVSLPEPHPRMAITHKPGEELYYDWCEATGYLMWTGCSGWSQWNVTFARWLEQEGIAVDYAASEDLARYPDILDGYKLFVSAGHDEYWSWEMRDTVETFISNGGNACFFSGNTCFWQVRYEDDFTTMITYKSQVQDDPVLGTSAAMHNTGIWSNPITRRPENQMLGVSYSRGGLARVGLLSPSSSAAYTIYRPEHWALDGTGLTYGDELGRDTTLIAYECDGCIFTFQNGLPVPTGEDGTPATFEIIGIAPVRLFSHENAPPSLYTEKSISEVQVAAQQITGNTDPETISRFLNGHAVMGSYTIPGGGTVFSSGTTEWVFGLSDPKIAKITHNLFDRLTK